MPINTEIEDKKTEINFNRKNNLLHSSITFPFYPDLGKNLDVGTKNGNLDFPGGGVICNFGFGLREKFGNLDFPEGGGGVICNFGFGLREKFGNLDFPGGGVICNFGFGLREKFGNLDFPEGGGNLQLRIWT